MFVEVGHGARMAQSFAYGLTANTHSKVSMAVLPTSVRSGGVKSGWIPGGRLGLRCAAAEPQLSVRQLVGVVIGTSTNCSVAVRFTVVVVVGW